MTKKSIYGVIMVIALIIGSGEAESTLTQVIVSLSCLSIVVYCYKKITALSEQDS